MQENSFGRKIKNNFSVTFKKDEEQLKLWLNEQISPASYIKKLILDDMKKEDSEVVIRKEDIKEEEVDFDFGSLDE